MNTQETLLTSKQVATKLQVTVRTIERWRKKGVIPAIKINSKTVRFKENAISHLLNPPTNG